MNHRIQFNGNREHPNLRAVDVYKRQIRRLCRRRQIHRFSDFQSSPRYRPLSLISMPSVSLQLFLTVPRLLLPSYCQLSTYFWACVRPFVERSRIRSTACFWCQLLMIYSLVPIIPLALAFVILSFLLVSKIHFICLNRFLSYPS